MKIWQEVMEKSLNFEFSQISGFSFEKNMLIGYTFDTVESVNYFTWYMCGGEGSSRALTLTGYGYGYGYILAV